MFEIKSKRWLSPSVTEMTVYAPRIAESAHPGQFLIVLVNEKAERIPLTICDYDAEIGTVTIVTQTVGLSSHKINALEVGDCFSDVLGPLGRPTDLMELTDEQLRSERILFVAGGVGAAPVYPQVKWINSRGVKADVIIGAKSAEMLCYVPQMEKVAGKVYLCTDDGSAGFHGMIPALMERLYDKGKYTRCVIIGSMMMMKFASLSTRQAGIPTVVSLNALMVDGTGMCGACRVTVDHKTRFTCVDGPEFDAHKVDFDEAMRRQDMYRNNPKTRKECNCHGSK